MSHRDNWTGCFLSPRPLPDHRYSFARRAEEKAESRRRDAEDIATGRRTVGQVSRDNGAFAFPREMVTLSYRSRRF